MGPVGITKVTDMPSKVDPPSILGKQSPGDKEVRPGLTRSPSKGVPFRTIATGLQAIVVLIAFCVHYFRVHHKLLFGVSLNGWAVPPECMVLCSMIGVLVIQHIGRKVELWKDTRKRED